MQRIRYWLLCWFCFKTPAEYIGYERALNWPEGDEPDWIKAVFKGKPRQLSMVISNIDPHHRKASKQEACAALRRQFPWQPIIEFPICYYGRAATIFVGVQMSSEQVDLELQSLGI